MSDVKSAFAQPDPAQSFTFGPPTFLATIIVMNYISIGGTVLLWASYGMDCSISSSPFVARKITGGALLYVDEVLVASEEQDIYLGDNNIMIDGMLTARVAGLSAGNHVIELKCSAVNFVGYVDGSDPGDFDCSILVQEHT